MRIALIADVFPPLCSSGAIQLRDLAIEFARQGHKVTAMIAAPELKSPWVVENMQGVQVLRLRTPKTRGGGYVARTINEFLMPYFMLRNLSLSPLADIKFEAIIWYSPTIFLGPIIKIIKKKSNCSAYLIVRDIFPEWAWEMELIRSKVLYYFFKLVAKHQYAQANVIGIQTPGNKNYFLSSKAKYTGARIEVLHNWLSEAPDVGCSIQIDNTKLSGRKIFVYAGNMGVAQNIEIFCDLAFRMQGNNEIGFLFVGRGSESSKMSKKYGALPNTLFCNEIPSEEIPGLYAKCLIGLVALDFRHKSHNIPGKFLSYMQAGLPVLACVNKGNDLIKLIEVNRVGVAIEGKVRAKLLDQAVIQVLTLTQSIDTKSRCRYLAMNMFSSANASLQILSALREIAYV